MLCNADVIGSVSKRTYVYILFKTKKFDLWKMRAYENSLVRYRQYYSNSNLVY